MQSESRAMKKMDNWESLVASAICSGSTVRLDSTSTTCPADSCSSLMNRCCIQLIVASLSSLFSEILAFSSWNFFLQSPVNVPKVSLSLRFKYFGAVKFSVDRFKRSQISAKS